MSINRVWAIDDAEYIKREDITNSLAQSPSNVVWNGTSVNLISAKNETVAFQLIIEANASGESGLSVELPQLTNGASIIKNTSTDATQYVGRNIEIFVEHYYNVTERSDWNNPGGGGNGVTSAKPMPDSKYTGWIPDGLVPIEAPSGDKANGQGGAPFKVLANSNQGIWVDIYVPKNSVEGTYTGNILIKKSGTVLYTIPINITVYNVTLPDKNNFFSWMFTDWPAYDYVYPGINTNNGDLDGNVAFWNMFRKYQNMFHRHRIDLVMGPVSLAITDKYLKEYITGTAFNSSNGYYGPGENVGYNVFSIGTYDQPDGGWQSGFYPATQAQWQSASDAWENWFLQNAPNVLRWKYMSDESPVANIQSDIIDRGRWIKNGTGVGKNLKVLATNHRWDQLVGVTPPGIDIILGAGISGQVYGYGVAEYTPGVYYNTKRLKAEKGIEAGFYNSFYPTFGNIEAFDVPLTSARFMCWAAFKYDARIHFLWETSYWIANSTISPWKQLTYNSRGDGCIILAGRDKRFPTDDRGVDAPIPTIRLKAFRRSLQDYELLLLAKNAGKDITSLLNSICPVAFNDGATNANVWGQQENLQTYPMNGYVFENAKKSLLNLLNGTTPAFSITTQPTNATVNVGETATFYVGVNESSVQYSWQLNGSVVGTSATLQLVNVTLDYNNSKIKCVVTNSNGIQLTTNEVTLTVNDIIPVPPDDVVIPNVKININTTENTTSVLLYAQKK